MLFVSTQVCVLNNFLLPNFQSKKKKERAACAKASSEQRIVFKHLSICSYFLFLNDDFIIQGRKKKKKKYFQSILGRIERLLQTKEQLKFRK